VLCAVTFPPTWIDAGRFDTALKDSCGPHDPQTHEVVFNFPAGCKIMIDGAIRMLSLANQLAFSTRRVRLNFEEGEAGTMGYLNRMAFFDNLDGKVEVLPSRPAYSGANTAAAIGCWSRSPVLTRMPATTICPAASSRSFPPRAPIVPTQMNSKARHGPSSRS
jgi:hypothetical protein